MKKSNLLKIFLSFALTLVVIIPLSVSNTEAAAKTSSHMDSYLMNPQYDYVYKTTTLVATLKFQGKYKGNDKVMMGMNVWKYTFPDNWKSWDLPLSEKETPTGYFQRFADGYVDQLISYPVKLNKTWNYGKGGLYRGYTITGINQTIKVHAGTFKNVIVVKCYYDKRFVVNSVWYGYYAKNVGLILQTDSNQEKFDELYQLKKRN